MGFSNFVNECNPHAIHYEKEIFKFFRTDTHIEYTISKSLSSERRTWLLKHLAHNPGSKYVAMHCIQQALSKGPKVLKLNNLDFELLENTTLNISIPEYAQAFTTMVVDLPENYSKSRIIRDPYAEGTHRPTFAIVCWQKETGSILLTIHMTSDQIYGVIIADPVKMIEEQLRSKEHHYDESLIITSEETEIFKGVALASLNACLYATNMGMKRRGPENPKHYSRLEHFLKRAQKENSNVKQAAANLRAHPIVYSFEQTILLQKHNRENVEVTGTHARPHAHWRRGHWRDQWYGPGLQLKKKNWIMPVLVNGDLFRGDLGDTNVTMED